MIFRATPKRWAVPMPLNRPRRVLAAPAERPAHVSAWARFPRWSTVAAAAAVPALALVAYASPLLHATVARQAPLIEPAAAPPDGEPRLPIECRDNHRCRYRCDPADHHRADPFRDRGQHDARSSGPGRCGLAACRRRDSADCAGRVRERGAVGRCALRGLQHPVAAAGRDRPGRVRPRPLSAARCCMPTGRPATRSSASRWTAPAPH